MISQARSTRRARSKSTARSRRPSAVKRSQLSMALRVLDRDRLGYQRRDRPGCDGRYTSGEPGGDFIAELAKSQEGPQGVSRNLNGRGAMRLDSCRTNAMESLGEDHGGRPLPVRSARPETVGPPCVGIDVGQQLLRMEQLQRRALARAARVVAISALAVPGVASQGVRERRRARPRWYRAILSSVKAATSMPRASHRRPNANACLATMQA